jgi:mannose-6-phosphate isomerase-like protein (cupin superfamily)
MVPEPIRADCTLGSTARPRRPETAPRQDRRGPRRMRVPDSKGDSDIRRNTPPKPTRNAAEKSPIRSQPYTDCVSVMTFPSKPRSYRAPAPGRTAALKLQNEQIGQSVMAFEEISPAGTATPLHLHHDSDEVMYILSGQFSFKIGDHVSSGGPGTCVFMPRGIPHAWKYVGNETGRAFIIYTPGEAGKVFEEAVRLQRPAPASTTVVDDPFLPLGDAQILERHGSEVVGPPLLAVLVAVTTLVTALMLSAFVLRCAQTVPPMPRKRPEGAYERFRLTKPVRLHYCDAYSAVPLSRRRSVQRSSIRTSSSITPFCLTGADGNTAQSDSSLRRRKLRCSERILRANRW